jgi:endonuclease YncB( thermonuclease family)
MPKKTPQAMSKTMRNALIAAFFFLLMPLVIVVDHRFGDSLRKAIEQTTYTTADRQTYHGRVFTVIEVVDGDTIMIDAPDGLDSATRVRLIGVDTPETKHPTLPVMHYGPEASEFTTRQVLGKEVMILLDTVTEERDRYGRLLAYVVLPDGTVLNEKLIQNGYGYAYLGFQHSKSADYERLMQEAVKAKAGLWKNAGRDDLPKWLRSKRPELLRHAEE